MKRKILLFVLFGCSLFFVQKSYTQQKSETTIQSWSENDSTTQTGSLLIGGYGEIHFNQQFGSGIRHNGKLDVHRLVLLLGYRFDTNLSFFSEIEFEHVREL